MSVRWSVVGLVATLTISASALALVVYGTDYMGAFGRGGEAPTEARAGSGSDGPPGIVPNTLIVRPPSAGGLPSNSHLNTRDMQASLEERIRIQIPRPGAGDNVSTPQPLPNTPLSTSSPHAANDVAAVRPTPAPPTNTYRQRLQEAGQRQAEEAAVVITAEKAMKVSETKVVRLLVQHGKGEDIVALTAGAQVADSLRVPVSHSAIASATATTPNIEIKEGPGFRGTQGVSYDTATHWAWLITPKSAGDAEFVIKLEHKLIVDGQEVFVGVKNFPRKVEVTIERWSQIKGWLVETKDILGVLGGIGAGIGSLWAYLKFFRKNKGVGTA